MAYEVVMPRLGWTMETGRLVEWLKHDGDTVQVGENLFTVESDKAVVEVEALDSGILRFAPDAPAADTDLAVGSVLAYLVAPDEPLPWADVQVSSHASVGSDDLARNTPRASTHVVQPRHDSKPAISPRALRVASELGIEWRTLTGSGSSGRIREADVRAAHAMQSPAPRATPLARRVAAANGVDLGQVASNGTHIARADVEAVISPPNVPTPTSQGVPLSGVRRVIAARMRDSLATTAPVTLTTEADATALVALRGHIKADSEAEATVPSVTDMLVRLAALTLRDHLALNASLVDGAIVEHQAIHIGVAVDTPRGLLVPVVRDADRRSLGEIATESAQLIERTRTGSTHADELSGSTFTISNLGMYEIDAFTPIINLPECAILGVGRIIARPVVVDETHETIVVRRMMMLSLTFDHRLVDGAPAARFLQQIKRAIEHPYRWITR